MSFISQISFSSLVIIALASCKSRQFNSEAATKESTTSQKTVKGHVSREHDQFFYENEPLATGGYGEHPIHAELRKSCQFESPGPKLKFDSYDVIFTNPQCNTYKYNKSIKSNSGKDLVGPPQNAFCTFDDFKQKPDGSFPQFPAQNKLVEWINDANTKEVFMSYFSFSNGTVTDALCKAVKERNVKVKIVMDVQQKDEKVQKLMTDECKPSDSAATPVILKGGHEGGIEYAHNKVTIINPNTPKVKIAFSSGNMSAGPTLHHENWHFIALGLDTYFAQDHMCLMNAILNDRSSKSKYSDSIKNCRANIKAQRESDISSFFITSESEFETEQSNLGGQTSQKVKKVRFAGDTDCANESLYSWLKKSESIDIAAHRFSHRALSGTLRYLKSKPKTRVVADDDLWWAGHGNPVGDNTADEFNILQNLMNNGAKAKFMQTNSESHLLHHNKYFIFNTKNAAQDAVWAGAGNLTNQAFENNLENFYFIRIPSVIEAFRKQYTMVWNTLATAPEDMPTAHVVGTDISSTVTPTLPPSNSPAGQ